MATQDDVQITVKVDAAGAIKAFDALGQEIAGVNVVNEKAQEGFTTMGARLVSLQAGIGLAKEAFSTMEGAAKVAIDTLSRGSQIDDVAGAFASLSDKAGTTADVFLNKLNSATDSTISNFELMQKANEALLAGLSPGQFTTVTQAARQFAEEIGGNLTDEMDKLTTAIQTGNDRYLKHKGIVVDNTQAVKDFADAMGIETSQVNELGRVEAMRLAMLQALKPKAIESLQITRDTGDSVQILAKTWSDLVDNSMVAVATNKGLADSLNNLAKSIQNIDFGPLINGITFIIDKGNDAIAIFKTLSLVSDLLEKQQKRGTTFWDQLFPSKDQQASMALDLVGSILVPNIKDAIEALGKADSAINKVGSSTGDYQEILNNLKAHQQNYVDQTKKQTDATKEFDATAKLAFESLKAGLEDQSKFLANSNKPGFGDGLIGSMFDKSSTEEFGAQVGDVLTNALHDGLQLALDKSAKGADWKVFTEDLGAGLGEAVGTYFGGQAGGAIGSVLGEKLSGLIFDSFGGKDSAGTMGRKKADSYFADLFDANRLAIIVNGQMQDLQDLVFTGNQDNSIFAGMGAGASGAFQGVGAAFEALLGIANDIGVNIAAVLANNVGGSLNNLQLLIKSTGLSAEQLSEQITKAFENGKLGALEAQTAMEGIKTVMQEGIPGAVGAVDEAFKNMMAAGTHGGATLVDAIKDIGAEAKELGIKDLPGIAEELKKRMPESAAAIDQLFKAMGDNGIKSIGDLTKATTEQLLPVFAQLEAAKFPFAEAKDDVDGLIAKVKELEKEIHTKVIVDVEVNDPAGALPKNSGILSTTGPTGGDPYRA